MSDSCSAFPFICASCVSSGVDGKLRMAVDGDAGQVVPDDLVDCVGGKERKGRSVYKVRRCFISHRTECLHVQCVMLYPWKATIGFLQ